MLLPELFHFRRLAFVEVLEEDAIQRGDEAEKLPPVLVLCPPGQFGVREHVCGVDGNRPAGAYPAPLGQKAVRFPNPVQVGEKGGRGFLKLGLLSDLALFVELLKPLPVLLG